MNKMIIGLCGPAGSGKDTIADYLVKKHGFVKMANADLLKRIVQQVFAFTDEQLWGPSEMRNAPDKRYPRKHGPILLTGACACCGLVAGDPNWTECYMTPRFALQSLGTEWGRMCFENIWVRRLLGLVQDLQTGRYFYDAKRGLCSWTPVGDMVGKMNVVISDVRFLNELEAIKAAGGKAVRVMRGLPVFVEDGDTLQDLEDAMQHLEVAPLFKEHTSIAAAVAQHKSETELLGIPQEKFDYLFQNTGDLHTLRMNADRMMDLFKGRIMQFDRGLQDAPPFLREKCRELYTAMRDAWPKHGTPQPGDPPIGTWWPNTEVHLWTDLQQMLVKGAENNIYDDALLKIKELSDAVNGWFSWRDKTFEAPYFVRRGKWLEEYNQRQER